MKKEYLELAEKVRVVCEVTAAYLTPDNALTPDPIPEPLRNAILDMGIARLLQMNILVQIAEEVDREEWGKAD